jgi:hypothetical protein
MRDRHLPRLCAACHVQLARQEESCWSCGTPRPASASARPPVGAVTMAMTPLAPGADTSLGAASDRWTNEGGSVRPQPAHR